MARRPRLFVLGYPHHIVQRGHDRKAVFIEPADYAYYLSNLIKFKEIFSVSVYAYCLMTNHVHLILAPREDGHAISALMRRLSGRQARYVNRLEDRSGTLWEGRFKSSIIDTDAYLLACMRYVDLNPVRARVVKNAADYRWSSCAEKLGLTARRWLDADPATEAIGNTVAKRRQAYRTFVESPVPDDEIELIRTAVSRNQLTGRTAFIDEIERRLGLRIENRGQGRPAKK